MTWAVALDPAAVISGRTELSLNGGGITVDQKGIDWGDAQIEAFKATQKWGENTVAYRVPNRTVTIPLFLGGSALALGVEEEVRGKLRQKVGLLQREGGVLLRQRLGGSPLYADVMSASLVLPDVWGETGEVEPGVVLVLECLPDFYGEEIALDTLEGVGNLVSVLKLSGAQAAIGGDYPARARIVVTDKSGQSQRGCVWGARSKHYSSSATARLYYDAVELTPINGAAEAIETPGTYSGKYISVTPETGVWHPFLEFKKGTENLTHLGSYVVWARVRATEPGVKLRLSWSEGNAVQPTENAAATIESKGTWELVNLGEVRFDKAPIGSNIWTGLIEANTGTTAYLTAVDRIWLQPVDESAGRARAIAVNSNSVIGRSTTGVLTEATSALVTGEPWEAVVQMGFPLWKNKSALGTEALLINKAGFALPSTAVVKGIEVETKAMTVPNTKIKLQLVKAGVLAGEAKLIFDNEVLKAGGPSDLWGATWAYSDVNAATFGFVLSVPLGEPPLILRATTLPAAKIKVYYSLGTISLEADAVIYANRVSEFRTEGGYREDPATEDYVRLSEENGDLVRLPTSGLEGRAVELLVKPSRGLLPEVTSSVPGSEPDGGIDKFTVQVKYRPCYLGRI